MSIEQDAQKDLALSDEDAQNVAGGKKSKQAAKKPAGVHEVKFTYSPGFTGADQPAQFVVGNTGNDDCSDGTETAS
jgi:hypothetical protein